MERQTEAWTINHPGSHINWSPLTAEESVSLQAKNVSVQKCQTQFELSLETLSPLHILSTRELRQRQFGTVKKIKNQPVHLYELQIHLMNIKPEYNSPLKTFKEKESQSLDRKKKGSSVTSNARRVHTPSDSASSIPFWAFPTGVVGGTQHEVKHQRDCMHDRKISGPYVLNNKSIFPFFSFVGSCHCIPVASPQWLPCRCFLRAFLSVRGPGGIMERGVVRHSIHSITHPGNDYRTNRKYTGQLTASSQPAHGHLSPPLSLLLL